MNRFEIATSSAVPGDWQQKPTSWWLSLFECLERMRIEKATQFEEAIGVNKQIFHRWNGKTLNRNIRAFLDVSSNVILFIVWIVPLNFRENICAGFHCLSLDSQLRQFRLRLQLGPQSIGIISLAHIWFFEGLITDHNMFNVNLNWRVRDILDKAWVSSSTRYIIDRRTQY